MLVNDEPGTSQDENRILHPSSRQLFRFWESTRAEHAAPRRDSLDLQPICHLLPNLFIGEHASRAGIFRWRLAGTAVCDLYRYELTGTNLLAGWDVFETDVISRFLHGTISELQPCVLRFRLYTDRGQEIGTELAGFPLMCADGETVHVFGGVFTFRDVAQLDYGAITRFEISSARTIWTEHLPATAAGERPAVRIPRHFHVIPGGRSS